MCFIRNSGIQIDRVEDGKIYTKVADHNEFANATVSVTDDGDSLTSIQLPKNIVSEFYWTADPELPSIRDVLHILNRVFKDYNIPYRIVKHQEPEEV